MKPASARAILFATVLKALMIAAPVAAGDAPAPSPSVGTNLDSAVGAWGGAIGSKIDGGILDAFEVRIAKAHGGGGYEAVTRADVSTTANPKISKIAVVTTYTGAANGGEILFRSTERKRMMDGGEPVLLVQAFMHVTPKDGHIEARVGNDAEGYTDFTLVPKKD